MLRHSANRDEVAKLTGDVFSSVLRVNDLDLENEGQRLLYYLQRDPNLLKGAVCLDAGCGRGEATYALASLGASKVIGVDVGTHLLDAHENNQNHDVVWVAQSSVLKLPFPSETFDVVHCSGVLHHTTNPEQGFSELVRVLKPGGLLFAAVVGREGLQIFVTGGMRLLSRFVSVEAMRRFLSRFLPYRYVAGLLDVGYAPIRRQYSERSFRAWFEHHGILDLKRTRSERYDYRSLLSRIWWGVGWIQISGFKSTRP